MALARLTLGINALAIVLYLRDERGSFAVAGVVAGALALGTGLGAPLQGRIVDRLGRRMLLPVAAGHATGLVALVLLARTDVPAIALVACAVAAGASMPPVSSVLRSLYRVLLAGRPELLRAAYALDSVVTEMLFVVGPLIVALLVVLVTAEAALLVSAGTVLAGTACFLALLPRHLRDVDPDGPRRLGGLGALASPGILTLTLTMLPFGAAFGMVEVVLPAFTRDEGEPGLAGVLLATWSVASAAGGFLYGVRTPRRGLADLHLGLALAVPLVLTPVALAPSVGWMALLLLPAGLPIAPLIATRNELAGSVAPAGAETEAYTWVLMAMVGGIALGAGVAGVVVDEAGWRAAAALAAGVSALGAVVALARRPSLAPAAAVS